MNQDDTTFTYETVAAASVKYVSYLLGKYLDINEVINHITCNTEDARKDINDIYKSITGHDVPSLNY